MTFAYEREVALDFDKVRSCIEDALAERGFSILTEIDVQKKFKEKTGHEMGRYVILGTCNPMYAKQAIIKEPGVGVFLPCNVVVRETDEGVTVSCILPTMQMSQVGEKSLCELAEKVETILKEAVDAV